MDLDKLNVVATYNLIYNATLMVEEGDNGATLTIDDLANTTSASGGLCFRPLEPRVESGLYGMEEVSGLSSRLTTFPKKGLGEI